MSWHSALYILALLVWLAAELRLFARLQRIGEDGMPLPSGNRLVREALVLAFVGMILANLSRCAL